MRYFLTIALFTFVSSTASAQDCRTFLKSCKAAAAGALISLGLSGCGSTSSTLTPTTQEEREQRFTDSERTIQRLDHQGVSDESKKDELKAALDTGIEDLLALSQIYLRQSPPNFARAEHLLNTANRLATGTHFITVEGSFGNTWSNMHDYWNVTEAGRVPLWPGEIGRDAEANAWKIYCPVSWPFVLLVNIGCLVGDATFHWRTAPDRQVSVDVDAALKTRVATDLAALTAQRNQAPLPAFNSRVSMTYRFAGQDPDAVHRLVDYTRSQQGFIPGVSRETPGKTFQDIWNDLVRRVEGAGGRVGTITVVVQESGPENITENDIELHAAAYVPTENLMRFIADNERYLVADQESKDRLTIRISPQR